MFIVLLSSYVSLWPQFLQAKRNDKSLILNWGFSPTRYENVLFILCNFLCGRPEHTCNRMIEGYPDFASRVHATHLARARLMWIQHHGQRSGPQRPPIRRSQN